MRRLFFPALQKWPLRADREIKRRSERNATITVGLWRTCHSTRGRAFAAKQIKFMQLPPAQRAPDGRSRSRPRQSCRELHHTQRASRREGTIGSSLGRRNITATGGAVRIPARPMRSDASEVNFIVAELVTKTDLKDALETQTLRLACVVPAGPRSRVSVRCVAQLPTTGDDEPVYPSRRQREARPASPGCRSCKGRHRGPTS